jgi:hypothetical protein
MGTVYISIGIRIFNYFFEPCTAKKPEKIVYGVISLGSVA